MSGRPWKRRIPPEARFWAKVDKGPECWLWLGSRNAGGYGRFEPDSRRLGQRVTVAAHRFAYEQQVGSIPVGLVLDHLCRNPSCVNPAHLEPVTNRENLLRGPTTLLRRYATRSECSRGHVYPPDTPRRKGDGGRRCLTCERAWNRTYYRQRVVGKP